MNEKLVVGFRFNYGDCTYEVSEFFDGKVYCDLVSCSETVFTVAEIEEIINGMDEENL